MGLVGITSSRAECGSVKIAGESVPSAICYVWNTGRYKLTVYGVEKWGSWGAVEGP